jgi:hypothetical protein
VNVVPWKRLDTPVIPGGGELQLIQRGREFSIRLGQTELMNSRVTASEEALAAFGHDDWLMYWYATLVGCARLDL